MTEMSPLSGATGPQSPQAAAPQPPPWENKIFAGYLAMIMLMQSILNGVYIPGLKDANLMNQGAQTILAFLSESKSGYMGNIDKMLTEFLNGWNYLQQLEKTNPSQIPPAIAKILNNPTFKNLAATLTQMANIQKHDPNYQDNPMWRHLEQTVTQTGGLLDKIYDMGQLEPDVIGQVQVFAQITAVSQQTYYQMASMELKRWDSIVKMASTFLKRVMSISQFLTSTTLR